jgi:hypothetical protein
MEVSPWRARAEIRRVVEQAVDTIPAPFRVVFMMRVVEQLSIEETAAALAIPAATVKTRLHRANGQLRAVLGGTFAAILEDTCPFGGMRCARLTDAVLTRLPRDGPTVPRRDRNFPPTTRKDADRATQHLGCRGYALSGRLAD